MVYPLCVSLVVFVSQAESAEEELSDLHSQHSELLEQLKEREDILRRLEEETSFLKVEYSSSQSEVCGEYLPYSIYSGTPPYGHP